jgi:tRNA(Ile)-lysidine synthase
MLSKPTKPQTSALLAVSGGLDSIVLLDLLSKQLDSRSISDDSLSNLIKDFVQQNNLTKLELAYINHNQRPDTDQDIEVIQEVIAGYNLTLHIRKLDLNPGASEHQARTLRYQALDGIQKEHGLEHLITAHHADDVLETAIINLSRGTGPKGLSSLRHHPSGIWRPYLSKFEQNTFITKQDLLDYADQNNLSWHEDSTNQSAKYFRNRVRSKLSLTESNQKLHFFQLLAKNQVSTLEASLITDLLIDELKMEDESSFFNKQLFLALETDLKSHFIHHQLSLVGYDVNRQAIQKALDFIETASPGKILQLKGADLKIESKQTFSLLPARQSIKKDQ